MVSNQSSAAVVDTAKSGSSLNDFTHTFVLSSASSKDQVLSEIPKALAVDPFRQRRAHQKSGTGCENCRRRRVKCSEGTPCVSCSRRGERCQRLTRYNRVISVPSVPLPAQSPLPGFRSTDAIVNLHHMKLFHHFQTYTRQTLMLTSEVWDHTLQLSFQFEFLMNTILCVTARHLAFLHPEDTTYPSAAASHLCRALPGFRHQLSNSFSSTHIDAFIATSLLLQYEAWTSTDPSSHMDDDDVSFDPTRDRVFAMGSSLKEVFLKCVPLISDQPSKFLPLLRYNPMDKLVAAARISNSTLANYQEYFSYHRPINLELLTIPLPYLRSTDLALSDLWQHHIPQRQNELDPIGDGYEPAIARLCLVLSFLPEAQPPDYVSAESTLFSDLARYILSFPVTCHGPFASMVQKRDPHALSLLYHFYHATRRLLPPGEYWWAHKRATVSEANLKEWLTEESIKQVDV
ncbi:hypothetical protein F4677DRAFT_447752 [Hypoxylon crocopeplum]|nr:hypothetical protein F4677DRAFT_447752 [Hypoxylon crocopeplum]